MTQEQRNKAIDLWLTGKKLIDISREIDVPYDELTRFYRARGLVRVRHTKWTDEEAALLESEHKYYNHDLADIQRTYFPDRTINSVRQKILSMRRKKEAYDSRAKGKDN